MPAKRYLDPLETEGRSDGFESMRPRSRRRLERQNGQKIDKSRTLAYDRDDRDDRLRASGLPTLRKHTLKTFAESHFGSIHHNFPRSRIAFSACVTSSKQPKSLPAPGKALFPLNSTYTPDSHKAAASGIPIPRPPAARSSPAAAPPSCSADLPAIRMSAYR